MDKNETTTSPRHHRHPSLANVKLTEEQSTAILEATGVNVTELTLIELKGEEARAIQPNLLTATVAVMCW
jgi:hypothetical protein